MSLRTVMGLDRLGLTKRVPPRCVNSRGRGTERSRSRRVGHVSRALLVEPFPRSLQHKEDS